MSNTLVIRVSVDDKFRPTLYDPLVIAESLMALYDEYVHVNHDSTPAALDLGADFLEAEWEEG
jgi:hypothetical protein